MTVPADQNPTAAMNFRRPWRPYQERVLRAIDEHLSDRRIHIVAAPGAGKTTLGLEVFRVLGQPAIALSPTRTIRDQWLTRLRDFLPDESRPAWAGTDLERGTFFTALTYQSLHAKFRNELNTAPDEDAANETDEPPTDAELNETVARCRRLKIGTVILDEAHHLRQEWWRVLKRFAAELGNPVLVSLTATPPYDVASLEWRRYEELCGPIDEEISIPELVRAGTLCPHQDYVWTCPPSEKDIVTIRRHDQAAAQFADEISRDAELLAALRQHPWIASAAPEAERVLDDPEFAFALLVCLRHHAVKAPAPLLRLLGCRAEELPAPDRRWWSVLLRRYLFGEEWPAGLRDHREALARRMRQLGLVYRREIQLVGHAGLQSALGHSSAKMDSCVAIHRLERNIRGASLRQVILTDFIREQEPDRLGAWPVFRRIAQMAETDATGVALLTGRLVIVHETALPEVRKTLPQISVSPEPDLPGFVRLADGPQIAGMLTRLLGLGHIHTLVGTRSLLGEGWDCPAVNSLVLASYVGAFVSTNQMRGRAIRIDPAVPAKAASVWHLLAADPGTPSGRTDLAQLEAKFASFAGLHARRPVIENGLSRLAMGALEEPPDLARWNAESARRAADLGSLGPRWQAAVELGTQRRVIGAVDAAPPPRQRSFVFGHTLRCLLYSAFAGFLAGAEPVIRHLRPEHLADRTRLYAILAVAGTLGLIFSLPKLVKCAWIAVRHVPADGSLRQIGWALLDALHGVGALTTARHQLDLRCREVEPGRFSLSLAGGTFYESSLYADSLAAVLGPIDNPRYVISRGDLWPWPTRRRDYHAVPPLLSGKKEAAELFHRHWRRRVGPGELIFTRNPEGRKALLRARVRALSAAFASPAQRRDRWC
jgi:superfamily II DNA or RNA helicase